MNNIYGKIHSRHSQLKLEPMKKRAKRASVIRQGMESVGVGLGI